MQGNGVPPAGSTEASRRGYVFVAQSEADFGALTGLGEPAVHAPDPAGLTVADVAHVVDVRLARAQGPGGMPWTDAALERLARLGYGGRVWATPMPDWSLTGDPDFRAARLAAWVKAGRRLNPPPANGHATNGVAPPAEKRAPEPVIVTLSSVAPEPVPWLWDGWLPDSTLCLLDGDPGLGKSSLTLDWAARVTKGWPMPPAAGDAVVRDPAAVLLLGAEDVLKYTVRPRLDAAGADADLVHSLEGFRESGKVRDPQLPWDLEHLAGFIGERGVRLVIVDPLMAFLGTEFDAHKDQDVRRCMRPLRDLAERLRVCILLVRHLNKLNGGAALYRGGGSIGITGAARASLIVGRDPQDPKRHVLAMNKINVGPLPRSLAYRIDPEKGVSRIGWEGECDLTRDDILWHQTAAAPGRPAQDRGFILRAVLPVAPPGMTADQVNDAWPGGKTDRASLLKAIDQGVKEGWVGRQGNGKRGSPFTHWRKGEPVSVSVWKPPEPFQTETETAALFPAETAADDGSWTPF